MTQATVSLSSAESEAKAITKGCIEALNVEHLLEHQTAGTFKIEVWTDNRSAKAIIQRLGPGRRAKHVEVQTMWVQQLNKLGLISMNKLGTPENVADMMTKHVLRGVLDKLAGMMDYSFPGEETAKFQEYSSIEQSYRNQKLATMDKLPIFDDGDNEELEHDVRSFVVKTTHLTTAALRRVLRCRCCDNHFLSTTVTY